MTVGHGVNCEVTAGSMPRLCCMAARARQCRYYVPLQVLACLLSFPATHPALPAPLQHSALLAMLGAFCQKSALSAWADALPLELARSPFFSDPEPGNQAHTEQAVIPAFEALAALGHESLLDSIAVPVLYATAQLEGLSDDIQNPKSRQSADHPSNYGSSAIDCQQAVRSFTQKDQWRREVALQALAKIACASPFLCQPILARLTTATPMSLAGASPLPPAACEEYLANLLRYFDPEVPSIVHQAAQLSPVRSELGDHAPQLTVEDADRSLNYCCADSSSAGLLDVLANAELLQQAGGAMCEAIASTLLTAYSRHLHVRLQADTSAYHQCCVHAPHQVRRAMSTVHLMASQSLEIMSRLPCMLEGPCLQLSKVFRVKTDCIAAQVPCPTGPDLGALPDGTLVQRIDRLMQLATSHAWSRQDALAAAAEQSLLQAVRSAEEGAEAAAPDTMPGQFLR